MALTSAARSRVHTGLFMSVIVTDTKSLQSPYLDRPSPRSCPLRCRSESCSRRFQLISRAPWPRGRVPVPRFRHPRSTWHKVDQALSCSTRQQPKLFLRCRAEGRKFVAKLGARLARIRLKERRTQAVNLGQKLPCKLNGILLEVVAERPVAKLHDELSATVPIQNFDGP